jgi:phosphate transport system permease protein
MARSKCAAPRSSRRLANAAFTLGCYLATALVIVPLGFIVWHLVAKGASGVSLAFFIQLPKPVGEPGGGMANAIAGTGADRDRRGSWRARLGGRRPLPRRVRRRPPRADRSHHRRRPRRRARRSSRVAALRARGRSDGRFSALAGGVALAMLMLPTIARSTEEVVRLVPRSYREARSRSARRGWRAIHDVVLPAAVAGVGQRDPARARRAARRDRAAALHRARQPLLVDRGPTRPIASLPCTSSITRVALRRLEPAAWTAALVLLGLVRPCPLWSGGERGAFRARSEGDLR